MERGKIFLLHPAINIFEPLTEELKKRNLEKSFVLFPHRRAIQFLGYYLSQKIKSPFLLPEAKAISDWVIEHYTRVSENPKLVLSLWDQAWLIYQAVKEVYQTEGEEVPSWEDFFPWCFHLARLFGELEKELIQIKDFHYPPSEKLAPQAEKILERQGKIYQAFLGLLEEFNAITPEQALRHLAEEEVPLPGGRDTFLVGFYALSRAEERLFEKMLEKGASLYLQSDPENPAPLHRRLLEKWKARFEVVKIKEEKSPPEFFFFEAYDLHSELKEFKKALKNVGKIKRPDQVAVLLPDPNALVPLLHFLPEEPVNITMGYPFKLTSLALFFNTLFDLILFLKKHKAFSKELLYSLIKLPYLGRFPVLEKALSITEAARLSYEKVLELAANERPDVEKIFKEVLEPLLKAKSLAEAVTTLEKIISSFEKTHVITPFEREALAVFTEKVLFPAKRLIFAKEKLGVKSVISYLKECLKWVSIPFEGDPLEGLQVMGLLETRLLSFEEVFVLEANEGVLPAVEEINPLLPQEVRKILGISDREKEEEIIRYHFERLLAGAKKVHLFWQYCTTPGRGEIEGKKVKSRFVEKIVWGIEKKYKKLFENTPYKDHFKKALISTEGAIRGLKDYLKKGEKVREKILNLLKEKVISPSLLEEYLRCPLKFFYARVLQLKAPEVQKEVAHNELGTAVHSALEEYFRKLTGLHLKEVDLQGRPVSRSKIAFKEFWELFKEKLKNTSFYRELPPEKRFLLEETARFRLQRYLLYNFPLETKIVTLERSINRQFTISEIGKFTLYGKIDRIDRIEKGKENYYLIIDYKTGKIGDISKKFWNFKPSQLKDYDEKTLRLFKKNIASLQLVFYTYLAGEFLKEKFGKDNWNWALIRPAFIELRKEGALKELGLQKSEYSLYSRWFEEEFEPCIKFLILHILESPYWYPAEIHSTCTYCEYRSICRHGF